MTLEPPPWDRKQYFKARKEERSEEFRELRRCGSAEVRKRDAVEYEALLNSASLDVKHSQASEDISEDDRAFKLGRKLCCFSAFHENCNRNSPVFGRPMGLALGVSANLFPERLCDAPSSDPVGFSSSRIELAKRNWNLSQSASGETITCVTPTTPSEEASPWKKPRLRWGEGLAKFEKKSVGSDDGTSRSETISCLSAQLSDCASPATPSSAACSSYPGSEDKPFTRVAVDDRGKGLSQSLVPESLKHLESFPFGLGKLDLSIITHDAPSLIAMLNSDNQCLEDASSTSCSVLSKLPLLKSEILKAIDMTESQVDLLESELKSIKREAEHNERRCLASEPSTVEFINSSGKVQEGFSEISCKPALPLHASTISVAVKLPCDNDNLEGLKASMDDPSTVTSKLIELPLITEPLVDNEKINGGDCFVCLDDSHFPQEDQNTSKATSSAGNMTNACINNVVGSNNSSLISSRINCHTAEVERLINSIWASNREYANKASAGFNIVFPLAGKVEASSIDVCSNDIPLRNMIVRNKKALRFKERALTLKWRALNSSWKNDMRLLSVRSHRFKAPKQCEIISRRDKTNRPSVCSNLLHVKESSLDMGKLLSVSHQKPCRSVLKMPALILNDRERRMSRFLSKNGLVEDPLASEKERSMINSWTSEEKDIFMDKLASHGKDFRKIASFLDHKTTADCVEFYYKNHKSETFTRAFKQHDQTVVVKSLTYNTYLITPAKKWDRDKDTASLEILGAASELVARNSKSKKNQKRNSRLHGVCCAKPLQKDCRFPGSPINFRLVEHDTGTAEHEILPSACCTVSSEALSSCITSSVSQGEGHRNGTPKAFSIISKSLSIPEDMQVDEETCSDESSCEIDVVFWTDREKSVFVRAVKSYGKDFNMVSKCIRTKSKDQCKSFYSKARKCLGLDIIHPDIDNEHQSVINDHNEDMGTPLPSTMEAISDTGSYKVSQRIDEDMSLSVSVTSNVDLLSSDAGMTFHACRNKLKDKEGASEKPLVNPKVEGKSVDKYASNLDRVRACNKSSLLNDANKQAFPVEVSVLDNKSIDISPSLSSGVPLFAASAHVETDRGLMESPLLYNGVENGTSSGSFQNNASLFIEDPGTPKASCQGPLDNLLPFGFTDRIPRPLVMYKGSERDQNSLVCLAHTYDGGLSNSTPSRIAALPAPEISFAKVSFREIQGLFQRSYCVGNQPSYQAPALSNHNQFYISQDFKQGREKTGSGWNLNFKDSTVSKGSHSDSENGLISYASIPPRGYTRKRSSLNSNCSVAELPYFKQSSHPSKSQTSNSDGPEKQANFKLFGQVLIPSIVQESRPNSHMSEENKITEFAQMNGTPVDTRPSNHHDIRVGSENLPVRSFWDGHQMQTVPLLAGCPIMLSHGMPSSSISDLQPLQTSAFQNVNAPQNTGSIFGSVNCDAPSQAPSGYKT